MKRKHFQHDFSPSDIETFLCTLTAYMEIDFDEDIVGKAQNAINVACCKGAMEKLLNLDTKFRPNELRMMAVSLNVADMAMKGQLDVSEEIKSRYYQHVFSINRLLPKFDALFAVMM